MDIILFFLLSTLGFCALLMHRNNEVYKYQIQLVDKISARAHEDIAADRDWKWRYEMMRWTDYDEMVVKFWKPLDSFYNLKALLGDEKPVAEILKNHFGK